MSFLQTTGIASQASDAFDRQRQEGRMNDLREEGVTRGLDDDTLTREIIKMAMQHQIKTDAAKAAAKNAPVKPIPSVAAIPGIRAPNAPGFDPSTVFPMGDGDTYAPQAQPVNATTYNPANQQMPGYNEAYVEMGKAKRAAGLADGSPVGKYSGIYDDTKVTDRMPTIFSEYMQDMQSPDFEHGRRIGSSVGELVQHINALADGGEVTNGVGTTTNFADGGEVKHDSIWGYAKHKLMKPKGAVQMAGGGAVRGPGTGTSDSVKAVGPGGAPFRLSNNEYVLPEDTVQAVGGVPVLDALRDATHTPVRR